MRSTMFWLALAVLAVGALRVFFPLGGFDEIRTGASPIEIQGAADGVWVLNYDDQSVSLVDPDTEEEDFTVQLENLGPALSANDEGAWVVLDQGERVARIDADSRRIGDSYDTSDLFPEDEPAQDVAAGDGFVWITSALSGQVVRLDTETGEFGEVIQVAENVAQPAIDGDVLWLHTKGGIAQLDVRTGETIETWDSGDHVVHDFTVSADSVWALVDVDNFEQTGLLIRYDKDTGEEDGRLRLLTRPSHLEVTGNRVYVTALEGLVEVIDTDPVQLVEEDQITVSTKDLRGVDAFEGRLWVADGYNGVAFIDLPGGRP